MLCDAGPVSMCISKKIGRHIYEYRTKLGVVVDISCVVRSMNVSAH